MKGVCMNESLVSMVSENVILWSLLKGIIIVMVTMIVLSSGQMMINRYFDMMSKHKKNMNKIITIKKVSNNIFKVIIIFVAVTMFLNSVLGIDTTSIITVAGVSGIAVGFASQNIVKDLIMGMMLLMEDHITIGDVIKVNAYKGVVEDLNLRAITLRDEEDVLHIIPNNIIKDFSNYSKPKENKEEVIHE